MNIIKRAREKGIAIYITTAMLVMIIPTIGLAVDGAMLYCVKCKLQGSVDGAALAAAKALARGSDGPAQQVSARAAAGTFVKLNYPPGFLFSADVNINTATDVTIDLSVANQRSITVVARVTEPTLFMRWLNFTSTTIRASATTVRRDVNLVLVLDRSGSMTSSGSCGPMRQAAINFVQNFAPGRDNLSVISFASSTLIQVPITTSFTQASMTTAINAIQCQGSTSTAAALWVAYDQLVGLNQPAALNFIVLFTDGEPTGTAFNMPVVTGSSCGTAVGSPLPTGLPAGYTGRYIRGLSAVYVDGSAWIELKKDTSSPNADGTPPTTTFPSTNDQVVATPSTSCNFASDDGNTSDFRGNPTLDIYGSATNTGYQTVTTSGGYISFASSNGISMSMNAADDAARRIRLGTTTSFPTAYGRGLANVIIHTVGLGNATYPLPADGTFLERLSNDPRSPIYDSTKPAGLFVWAAQSSDIGTAFGQIASEILRIAR